MIIRKTGTHLYQRYPNQNKPQPTFIEFAPEEQTLFASVDSHVDGGTPEYIYNGLSFRWSLPSPYLTGETINEILTSEDLLTLLVRLSQGYEQKFDGSSLIGTLTEDAQDAYLEIEVWLERWTDTDLIKVCDPWEYFGSVEDEIKERLEQGEDIMYILDELTDDVDVFDPDLEDYIEEVFQRE